MHRSFRSIALLRSSFSSKIVSTRFNYKNQYKFSTQSSPQFSTFNKFIGASVFLGSAALFAQQLHADNQEEIFKVAGSRKDNLKDYTLEEIAKHNNKDNRIWVIYKNGVYDITDFIEMHPGQEKILQAAGTSIEPFWAMYSQHLTPEILEMLEELRIGNLAPNQQMSAVLDAYASDPGNRSSALVVRSKKPFNAEVPPELLVQNLVTPNDLFFVRNHLPVPIVNPKDYVLEISADTLDKPIRLTLDDLKNKFAKQEVMATIQCAGNRRNEMTKIKEVKGGFWETGAISNAVWTGVRLRDVLIYAGLNPDDLQGMEHVQFTGLDKDFEKSYGASIPIDKALSTSGDVILAFEMNGKELPPDHGYPVRVVVPGVGARNVKWLHKIHASKEESASHWQQKDYKGFSPNVDWHNVVWDSAPAIQDYPVQSAICLPQNGAVLSAGKDVTVKGFAWSGGGRGIVRVDVSVDGGQTWHTADLQGSNQRYNRVWAWSLWEARVAIPEGHNGKLDIVCKAVDSSYNTQPERVEPIWNLRGVLSNAWHHVNVSVEK